MMDETDLKQSDPKRSDLHQDRIIMDYAIKELRRILHESGQNVNDLLALAKTEEMYLKKLAYIYKADQIKLLQDILEIYEDQYLKLIKEDSL